MDHSAQAIATLAPLISALPTTLGTIVIHGMEAQIVFGSRLYATIAIRGATYAAAGTVSGLKSVHSKGSLRSGPSCIVKIRCLSFEVNRGRSTAGRRGWRNLLDGVGGGLSV
jgi:hypothetical protein